MTDAATLRGRVEARFSSHRLVALSRPNAPNYSTENETFLETACEDVIGELDLQGVGAYDDTDAAIVKTAADGVIALMELRNQPNDLTRQNWDTWQATARKLRGIRRHSRIGPTTGTSTARARFPRRVFNDVTPGEPGRTSDEES